MDFVTPTVDTVVLTRAAEALPPEVERGIRCQSGAAIVLHRVVGEPQPTDHCRWQTIARARNEGKRLGGAPWLMFVDDDVVLEPGCVAALIDELSRRPMYGALAADYLGERCDGQIPRHVAMGATLFRRQALERIYFRWGVRKCECQCCCDDLRQSHWGIDYSRSARAHHLAEDQSAQALNNGVNGKSHVSTATGMVLAAFNRRDLLRFHEQFLGSLRASGNPETVVPLAVGLDPGECQRLVEAPGLNPEFRDENGINVARRRLRDFAEITAALPPSTPVASWDAGDVIFQSPLQPLWDLIRAHPGQLLAVREPIDLSHNAVMKEWYESIADPQARREVQQTIRARPILNSGFVAGEAGTLAQYYRTVAGWYETPRLAGSSDWGDQLALNVYCHSNPALWHEVSEGWNYCLLGRDHKSYVHCADGRYVDLRGLPVHVVHGNARTLHSRTYRHSPF